MNNKIKLKYFTANIELKYKIIVALSIISLIFLNMSQFISTVQIQSNGYDFLLKMFSNYFFSIYTVPIGILVLLYNIDVGLNNYIYLRFKSKKEWFKSNVLVIAKLIFIVTSSIIFISIILSLLKGFNFYPEWSSDSLINYSNVPKLLKYNPIIIVIIQFILFYMYLFSISLLAFTFNIIYKNNIVSFLYIIFINSLNIAIILSKLDFIGKISFSYNMLLGLHSWGINPRYPSILFSIIYWIIIIIIIYICSIKYICKFDLIEREK